MKTFSIKRIGLLLRSEFKIQGMQMLIGWCTLVLLFSLITLIPHLSYHGIATVRASTSSVLATHSFLLIFGFCVAFFVRVHHLVHDKEALPYVALPASTIEKYIEIILLGFIYLFMALLVIQINYWIELWLYPSLRGDTTDVWSEFYLIEGTSLINPLIIFDSVVATLMPYTAGLLLLITMAVPKKRFAIPIAMVAPFGLLILTVHILVQFFDFHSLNISPGEEMGDAEIITGIVMGGVAIASLIGSYLLLRNKQVKS